MKEFLRDHWLKIPIVLYALGFVVHNLFLSNFGSYEFELVQAKYILSGFGVVAFSIACFAYISIKVNLSDIFDMFNLDKLLPWLLRVISLPYAFYTFLYLSSVSELSGSDDPFSLLIFWSFLLGNAVVSFSIFGLVYSHLNGNDWVARLGHFLSKLLAIPMIVSTVVIGVHMPEFMSVVQATTYLFFVLIGIGLSQQDDKIGVNPEYLDVNAKESHKTNFTILFGLVAIIFMFGAMVSHYVEAIYPKIPIGLGGSKLEFVEIYSQNKVFSSQLIQETGNWTLYINNSTGNVEKIKTELIEKIILIRTDN